VGGPPHPKDDETMVRWQQRGEAAAQFCYVVGGASALVLIVEGLPGYGVVTGFVGCAFAELCTMQFERNRSAVVSKVASLLVLGVAGYWVVRKVWKTVNERWEEDSRRLKD